MSATVSPSQSQMFTALVSVLTTFSLAGADGNPAEIIKGQVNRTPQPSGQDMVVLWPIARDRLAMNIDTTEDVTVTGAITDNVLTVSDVTIAPVQAGQILYNIAGTVTPGCQVIRQLTGTPGGAGTYQLSPTAPVGSGTIYLGMISALQETEFTVQADVHGPLAGDNAARIQALFRDQYAVDGFLAAGIALTPLYTSDPKQIPFDNGEQQVEERWVIDLCMQADIAVTTTMQFADQLKVTVTPVETLL